MRTTDLTSGERLLILRRRTGRSQRDEAERRGITLYRYKRYEADEQTTQDEPVGELKSHERCLILRRRERMSLDDLASELGVSRWWACQMEYGRAPADRLVKFWENRTRPWRGRAVQHAK